VAELSLILSAVAVVVAGVVGWSQFRVMKRQTQLEEDRVARENAPRILIHPQPQPFGYHVASNQHAYEVKIQNVGARAARGVTITAWLDGNEIARAGGAGVDLEPGGPGAVCSLLLPKDLVRQIGGEADVRSKVELRASDRSGTLIGTR
jgi:hypothetical protein